MSTELLDRARSEINDKTELFLSLGGEIQKIPAGKTGYKRPPLWTKSSEKKPEA
ncbi:hypothetical protein ACOXVJ_24610 [Pseudomonas knackmussii]|uniref:hypothetical protein n=1 Tax=Pseudomonas knackmussii TaxID=65741 RepID=UPI001427DD9C|nr:hypothetical protein [Pseudomonas knackmussii]